MQKLVSGMVWGQSEMDIKNALSNLPSELQGKLNETQIESVKNQTQQIFKEKCEKNGGFAAYEAAQVCFIPCKLVTRPRATRCP